jgi:glucose-6-phosphate 1-dehydrogenase
MPSSNHRSALIPGDHVIVLFGATGDLAKRKLLPGLFHLAKSGLLPHGYRIIGSAPAQFAMTDEQFRAHAKSAVAQFGLAKPTGKEWQAFESKLHFGAADPDDPKPLVEAVREAEAEIGGNPGRLYHLAVPPSAFGSVVSMLGQTKLAEKSRVIIEKPFGTDLESARALTKVVHAVFEESQIFRIDHFLGKESVDNILALRFANGLFEPIWNRDHIEHVQIDVPETLSVGTRAGFYEKTGAYRDMVVTHLFQVLGFLAMEPPTSLEPKKLGDEKVKVFDALAPLRPHDVLRGQYEGYRQEQGVDPDSQTETFVALRAFVDNWRWQGVPFYLRTGKNLAQGRRVITITFREPALQMFPLEAGLAQAEPNSLSFELGEPGSIRAQFLAKVPGATLALGPATMTFSYEQSFCTANQLEAYERLIHDAMIGDRTLFTRADGIERLWAISAPLLDAPPPVRPYAVGSWGPDGVEQFIAPGRWHLPDDEV